MLIFFYIYTPLYILFLAALSLCCCMQAVSSWGELGLLASCSTQVSRCVGFSCFRTQALGAWASVVATHGLSSCYLLTPGHAGFSSCGPRAHHLWLMGLRRVQTSVVVPRGLHCSKACGIFLDQGLNPCPCIRRWILIHCATRKPSLTLKNFYLLIYLFGCVELVVGCVSCAMQDLSMQLTDCLVAAWASGVWHSDSGAHKLSQLWPVCLVAL